MKKKIMIVEDEETVAKIYANQFRFEGYEVETQTDGDLALKRIAVLRPDALLLDLEIPLVHGVEVIRRLRAETRLVSLPIVVLSNAYDHGVIEQAWKAGASMCLIKAGSSPAQVVAAVKKAMSVPPAPVPGATARVEMPAPAPAIPFAEAKPDSGSRAEILRDFVDRANNLMAEMRSIWGRFVIGNNPAEQRLDLGQIARKLHSFSGNAAAAECPGIANLSSALETLLKELFLRPEKINPSILRTVELTLEFLGFMARRAAYDRPMETAGARVLVVDDEIIALKTAETALQLVNLKPTLIDRSSQALAQLRENAYDLILLDIDMPEISGIELCTRLRLLPLHEKTPVIFVTGMSSFENRVQSAGSGGNDFIGKPFLVIELAVKALTNILRSRVQG